MSYDSARAAVLASQPAYVAAADALRAGVVAPAFPPLPPLSAYYTPDPAVTGTTRTATTPAELTALCDPNTSHPGDGILISGMLKGFFSVPPGVIVKPAHAAMVGGDGITGGLTMLANSALLDLTGTQAPDQASPAQVFCTIHSPGVVVRRCVVHDIYNSAFEVMGAKYAEISDCIGYNALSKGYFIYTHNDAEALYPDGTPRTVDIFRNLMWKFSEGYGLHCYSAGQNFVKNYRVIQNFSLAEQSNVGGITRPTSNFLFQANGILAGGGIRRFGWAGVPNADVRIVDNVLTGGTVELNDWQRIDWRGNILRDTLLTSSYPLPLGSPFTDKLPNPVAIPLSAPLGASPFNLAWVVVYHADAPPAGASRPLDVNGLGLVVGQKYKLVDVQTGVNTASFTYSAGMPPLQPHTTTADQLLALRTN